MDLHLPSNLKANLNPEKLAGYLPHKVQGALSGKNVGTAERILSGALGFLLLRSALKRGAIGKAVMLPAALAALKRAATGKCELYQAAGLSSVEEKGSVSRDAIDDLKHNFGQKSLDQNGGQPLYN